MPREEVIQAAKWAFQNKMGTLMLQARPHNASQRDRPPPPPLAPTPPPRPRQRASWWLQAREHLVIQGAE